MNQERRAEIFAEKKDYKLLLDLLKESFELINIEITAYCIMPSHDHLYLYSPSRHMLPSQLSYFIDLRKTN